MEIKKSYVVAVRSESESSDKGEFYGSNYAEYVNNDIHNNEIIGNIRQNTYSSSHLGGSREQRGSDSGDYNSQNAGYGFQFNDFINRSPVQTTMPFAPTSLGTNLLTMPNGSLGVQQSYSTQRISVNQTNFVTSSQQRTFKTAEFSSGFEGNEIQYADDSGRVTRQHSDL